MYLCLKLIENYTVYNTDVPIPYKYTITIHIYTHSYVTRIGNINYYDNLFVSL